MGKIEFTNIIIDDFSLAQKDNSRTYIHVLSHIHTDHLKGLSDGWNYGPIYCTEITKNLLNLKYPSLNKFVIVRLNQPIEVKMSHELTLTLSFFDANHCAGAVMVLLQGYMGRILYTGDMRFNKEKFIQHQYLYPPDQLTPQFKACSIKIDVMYIDNTFLKPRFDFPPQEVVKKQVIQYIDSLLAKNQVERIYIGLDNYGKEEVLEEIARHYNIYINVDQTRFENIKAMGYDEDFFTTNPHQGSIQVVSKQKLVPILKQNPNTVGIILTGWANEPRFRFQGRIHCLPYSLHSNYREVHQFVASIGPSEIYPIVHQELSDYKMTFEQNQDDGEYKDDTNTKGFTSSQVQKLRQYCTPRSEKYDFLVGDINYQKQILKRLKLPQVLQFTGSQKPIPLAQVSKQALQRRKYRFSNQRNESELQRIKNQIKQKKQLIKGTKNVIELNQQEEDVIDLDEEELELIQKWQEIEDEGAKQIVQLSADKPTKQQKDILWETAPKLTKKTSPQHQEFYLKSYIDKFDNKQTKGKKKDPPVQIKDRVNPNRINIRQLFKKNQPQKVEIPKEESKPRETIKPQAARQIDIDELYKTARMTSKQSLRKLLEDKNVISQIDQVLKRHSTVDN